MKIRLNVKENMGFLCFLCCLSYFVSYVTRMNYAACLVEIQRSLQITKSQAGLPVTGSFLTYGVGQLICGVLGDKVMPHKIIFMGLIGTALCNFLVAVFPQINVIMLIWCINGFFQSMLWPPLVRIMAESLDEHWYRRCSMLVFLASSAGSVMVYVLAPICFWIYGWQMMFYVSALAGIVMALYWIYGTKALRSKLMLPAERDGKEKKHSFTFYHHATLLLPIFAAIILMGVLRDGLTTWMPAYMMDTFEMNTSFSTLITAILPLFSVISILLASFLYDKLKDELMMSSLLFGISLASCGIMLCTHGRYVYESAVLMMLITGCMHGIHLMLIGRIPKYFAKFGIVSTVSGVLNAFAYTGSSISTFGFGAIAEKNGWFRVVFIWMVISGMGALLLMGSIKKWKRFCESSAC